MWLRSDEDVSKIIENTTKGEVDHRLRAMLAIVVSFASQRFGHIERDNTRSTYTMNCRANKIHQLLQDLRILKQHHKVASEEEKQLPAEPRNIFRSSGPCTRQSGTGGRGKKEQGSVLLLFLIPSP